MRLLYLDLPFERKSSQNQEEIRQIPCTRDTLSCCLWWSKEPHSRESCVRIQWVPSQSWRLQSYNHKELRSDKEWSWKMTSSLWWDHSPKWHLDFTLGVTWAEDPVHQYQKSWPWKLCCNLPICNLCCSKLLNLWYGNRKWIYTYLINKEIKATLKHMHNFSNFNSLWAKN